MCLLLIFSVTATELANLKLPGSSNSHFQSEEYTNINFLYGYCNEMPTQQKCINCVS
jgi:hypothetical protein